MRTDPELLEAWRSGDPAAGGALFERYYPSVARFFANKVGGDPADLIQETFVTCLQRRDAIVDAERFRSYVFGIAFNLLRRHYARGGEVELLDLDARSVVDLGAGPHTIFARSGEQRLLLEALRRIPLRFQIVLELFYWEELTSAAIADALDEPHGTVRTRLRRARELLEDELARVATDPAVLRRTMSDLESWAASLRGLRVTADGGKPPRTGT